MNLEEKNKSFKELLPGRKGWLTRAGCRYIWTNPTVIKARQKLSQNLSQKGLDVQRIVIDNIAQRMNKYFQSFNLIGTEEILAEEIRLLINHE